MSFSKVVKILDVFSIFHQNTYGLLIEQLQKRYDTYIKMIVDHQKNIPQNGVGPDLTKMCPFCDRFKVKMGPFLRRVKNQVFRPREIASQCAKKHKNSSKK